MPTTYTSLLGFALPATGELSGTWGATVNDFITQYVDAAVAGAQTISGSQTAVTLSVTNGTSLSQAGSGSTGSAQYHIINCTGNPAGALTVTVPSSSRAYLVLNNTSTNQTVTVKGAATTGVTVSAARAALIAWNGTDFELVGTDDASRLNGVLAAANGGTGQSSYTVGDILFASGSTTLSKLADVATGNALISGGVGVAPSYGKIGLTTHVSGTLPIANGGTNATATPTAGTIAYGTGSAYAFNTAGTSGQPLLSGGSGAPTFGTLSVGAGGTGATSLTSNNVILGNGTSAVQFVAPGTNGNVLTSNGTTWTSAVLPAGGLTYIFTTTPVTATDKQGVLTDTSGGSFTVTLPATPATGAQVVVADAGSNWGTNNLTVGRNGSTIGGLAENLVCDITGASVQFVYDGTTWEVYAQIGGNGGNAVTLTGVQTLTNKTINGASNTLTVRLANDVTGTLPIANGGTGTTSTQFANLTTNVTGTLPVANGGTGAVSLTANNVLLGNGTSALQVVAPGANGNVLVSNGTTWTSAAPAGGGNWVLIQTNTFSSAANIDMTGMSSTYDLYFIEGVITNTGGQIPGLAWRFINSASTVLTGSEYCGNLWGGEENTTNMRWYTAENFGRFLNSTTGYGPNIDISFNMYINRSPSNEYQGVWGNTMSLYSTYPSPSWFSGGYRALMNLNGIRIFDYDTGSPWSATGTLRLWGWKKT
jgi:hypothetical protein